MSEIRKIQYTESLFLIYSKVKGVVVEIATNSSTHGLPNIARTNSFFLKIMWFIFTVLCTSICLYLNVKTILNYLDYEVVTKISVINQIPAPFPTITICSLNMLATDYAIEYSTNMTKSLLEQAKLYDLPEYSENFSIFDPELYRYIIVSSAADQRMNDQQRKALGISLEKMMIKCIYNFQPCQSSDFEWFYDTWYGNCYKFNSGKNSFADQVADRLTEKSGFLNGLRLELVIPNPISKYAYASTLGVHLLVHNKSVLPSYFEGIEASMGRHTNIAITRTFTHRLPSPYSNCVENIAAYDSFYTKFFSQHNLTYKQMDCFNYCYQSKVVETCGCYDKDFLLLKLDVQPCMTLKEIDCQEDQYDAFFYKNVVLKCPGCPEECTRLSYQVMLSHSDFPSVYYAKSIVNNSLLNKLLENVTEEEKYLVIKRNVLSLNAYYERIPYTFLDEEPRMDLEDLISNLGGTLGLFIGISFLSFVELLELVIKILVILLTIKPRSKTNVMKSKCEKTPKLVLQNEIQETESNDWKV